MKCLDCPHFEIQYEPLKSISGVLDFGRAKCSKFNLIVDFTNHRKLKKLECKEETMSVDRCIVCGNVIPEGRNICSICANKPKSQELDCKGFAYSKDGSIYRTSGNFEGVSKWVETMARRTNIYFAEMKVMQ